MTYKDVLDHKAMQAIYRHATDAYPDECCGFVFANAHAVHITTRDIRTGEPASQGLFSFQSQLRR
ncbi:hypothetical protein D9M69_534920 [compost metagenome]